MKNTTEGIKIQQIEWKEMLNKQNKTAECVHTPWTAKVLKWNNSGLQIVAQIKNKFEVNKAVTGKPSCRKIRGDVDGKLNTAVSFLKLWKKTCKIKFWREGLELAFALFDPLWREERVLQLPQMGLKGEKRR